VHCVLTLIVPSGPAWRQLTSVAADLRTGRAVKGNGPDGFRTECGRYGDIDNPVVVSFTIAGMATAADDVEPSSHVGTVTSRSGRYRMAAAACRGMRHCVAFRARRPAPGDAGKVRSVTVDIGARRGPVVQRVGAVVEAGVSEPSRRMYRCRRRPYGRDCRLCSRFHRRNQRPWQSAQVERFALAAVIWVAGSQLEICFPVSELKYDWSFGLLHPTNTRVIIRAVSRASCSRVACFAPSPCSDVRGRGTARRHKLLIAQRSTIWREGRILQWFARSGLDLFEHLMDLLRHDTLHGLGEVGTGGYDVDHLDHELSFSRGHGIEGVHLVM